MFTIKKVENVVVNVDNLGQAVDFFGKLLGITFEPSNKYVLPDGMEVKVAISPLGIELLEQTKPRIANEGLRGFSVRVKDINEAKSHLKDMGISPIVEFEYPFLKEAIYHIRGIRLAFEEYQARSD